MKIAFIFFFIGIYFPLISMDIDIASFALELATICNVLDEDDNDPNYHNPLIDLLKKASLKKIESIILHAQKLHVFSKEHYQSNSQEIEDETFFFIFPISLLK